MTVGFQFSLPSPAPDAFPACGGDLHIISRLSFCVFGGCLLFFLMEIGNHFFRFSISFKYSFASSFPAASA